MPSAAINVDSFTGEFGAGEKDDAREMKETYKIINLEIIIIFVPLRPTVSSLQAMHCIRSYSRHTYFWCNVVRVCVFSVLCRCHMRPPPHPYSHPNTFSVFRNSAVQIK